MKAFLTIIIPAKREEHSILETLKQIKKTVKTPHSIFVIIDRMQGDRTGEIVKEYLKKDKRVSLIVQKSSGFAEALKRGIKEARGKFIIPVMADSCDRLEDIDPMFNKIQEGWDIVCGSRYTTKGGKRGGPLIQSIFSRLVCITLHDITKIPTTDVSNAFKMYRKSIFNLIKIDPLSGVEVSMDITLQAYFKGAKITEIPTLWTGRSIGRSKFNIIQRAPRYFRLYLLALKNTFRLRI